MSLVRLFFIFVKMGAILLGGGFVILPIMTNEFCDKRKLLPEEELVEYFALSQSLPGIIAANMSIFVGYKLRGKLGALAAIAGIIFVPFWSIVFIASVISIFVNNPYVQNIFWGVGVGVIALIGLTAAEIWQKNNTDWFFRIIFVLSLISLVYFKISPVQVILIFTVLGVLLKKFAGGRA